MITLLSIGAGLFAAFNMNDHNLKHKNTITDRAIGFAVFFVIAFVVLTVISDPGGFINGMLAGPDPSDNCHFGC